MEPIEPNKEELDKKKSQTPTSIERVTIGSMESESLERWVGQMKVTTKGFLDVSKSDLVNFMIRDHKEDLSHKEISNLRAHLYDPMKHISWIAGELKKAFAKQDLAMVALLQEEIKNIEVLSVVTENSVVPADRVVRHTRSRSKKKTKSNKGATSTVTEDLESVPGKENLYSGN